MKTIGIEVSNGFAFVYSLLREGKGVSSPDGMHSFWTAQAHDIFTAVSILTVNTYASPRQVALHSYSNKEMRASAFAEAVRLGLLAHGDNGLVRGPQYDAIPKG